MGRSGPCFASFRDGVRRLTLILWAQQAFYLRLMRMNEDRKDGKNWLASPVVVRVDSFGNCTVEQEKIQRSIFDAWRKSTNLGDCVYGSWFPA